MIQVTFRNVCFLFTAMQAESVYTAPLQEYLRYVKVPCNDFKDLLKSALKCLISKLGLCTLLIKDC